MEAAMGETTMAQRNGGKMLTDEAKEQLIVVMK